MQPLRKAPRLKSCDVPKTSQAVSEICANKFWIGHSNMGVLATTRTVGRQNSRASDAGKVPSDLLAVCQADEEASESKSRGNGEAAYATWINRILFTTASNELSRLKAALRDDDTLKLAIQRECQSDRHPLHNLVKAYESVTVSRNRVGGVRIALTNVFVENSWKRQVSNRNGGTCL